MRNGTYIYALNQGNVSLFEIFDKLVWMYNSREGQVTAKLAYQSTISMHISFEVEWWMKWLWKGAIPLKIKLFSWLCMKNKILTWEVFWAWQDVLLCFLKLDSVSHMFGDSAFFHDIWL